MYDMGGICLGILITGCQSFETSADVTGKDGRAFGALSHTVTKIVRRHQEKYPDVPITCRQLVLKVGCNCTPGVHLDFLLIFCWTSLCTFFDPTR